jgi:chromosome segregation ATPase
MCPVAVFVQGNIRSPRKRPSSSSTFPTELTAIDDPEEMMLRASEQEEVIMQLKEQVHSYKAQLTLLTSKAKDINSSSSSSSSSSSTSESSAFKAEMRAAAAEAKVSVEEELIETLKGELKELRRECSVLKVDLSQACKDRDKFRDQANASELLAREAEVRITSLEFEVRSICTHETRTRTLSYLFTGTSLCFHVVFYLSFAS